MNKKQDFGTEQKKVHYGNIIAIEESPRGENRAILHIEVEAPEQWPIDVYQWRIKDRVSVVER